MELWTGLIFVSIFLVFPIYADQFMFRFQSLAIILGMLLVVWSTIYFYQFYKEKNRVAFVAAVCMEVIAFGIYQSLVNLQICFFITLYFFHMMTFDWKENKSCYTKEQAPSLLSYSAYEFAYVVGVPSVDSVQETDNYILINLN